MVSQSEGSPAVSRWRWIASGIAVAALIASWYLLPLKDWMDALEAHVKGMGLLGGILYVAVYVVASLLFVPGSILGLGAGYVFGITGGMAVVWVGVILAAAAGFLVARYLARDRVERLARRSAKFGALDAAIGMSGWKAVGLVRLAAVVPFSLANYFFGLTSVRFVPFVAATAVSMLPGLFFYVYVGAAGKTLGEVQRSPWEWVILGAAVLATAAMAVVLNRVTKKLGLRRPSPGSPSSAVDGGVPLSPSPHGRGPG